MDRIGVIQEKLIFLHPHNKLKACVAFSPNQRSYTRPKEVGNDDCGRPPNLYPRMILTFDLPIPKVDRFMPLSDELLVGIEICLFVSTKISVFTIW